MEAFLRRGTLLTVALLIIMIFGVLAALRIPVQMIPDLEVRTITVRTEWPGATPQDVEKEILIEQEDVLRKLPNLRRMIANASTGSAVIELEFPFGVEINDALIRVNNALSQVPDYPENVDEPVLFTESFSANAFIYYSITPQPGNPRGLDMNMMRDFVDDRILTPLERIPGVSQVDLRGGAERQIQIRVDPARLAQRGITIPEVRDAIRARNQDVSAGDLDSGKRRYLLRTVGRFADVAEFEELIVRRDGDAIVRLKEVAEVELGHFEIRTKSYTAGEPSLFLAIRRETGSNVIEIRDRVFPLIEQLRKDVIEPNGMQMLMVTDDVEYVDESIGNVWKNLAIGALLASLVMFLFLRNLPTTVIGMCGIPVCTIAAFIGLLMAERTINVISLAGIAFAIGMTLDNTIVVLENIERKLRDGMRGIAAAAAGVVEVWPAVLASTMTTILVFAPVLFVQQEAGQLYSDIALAIGAAILMSMLFAIAIVPAACARIYQGGSHRKHQAWSPFQSQILGSISWLIAGPWRRLTCLVATIGITVAALVFLTPSAEYLPEGEEPKTFSLMIAPPGYSLEEMDAIAGELHDFLLPAYHADPEDFATGKAEVPSLRTLNLWVSPQLVRIISMPTKTSDIDALMEVMDEKFLTYPGMRAFSSRGSIISSNDGGTRSINLDISGPDLATIYQTAGEAFRYAQDTFDGARINSDPSSLVLGQPLIEVRPRWERVAEMGFDAGGLGYTISALTDGAYVDDYFLADDKIDIFLYGREGIQDPLESLSDLTLHTPAGGVVPLSSVADIVETVDSDAIRRVNGKRTVTLNVIPPRSVPLESAVQEVQENVVEAMKRDGKVPADVSIDISGASDQLTETRKALAGNFLVSIVLCYLLLVVIYKHWGFPWIIMATVPLGIAGGIGGLWFLNLAGGWLPLLGLRAINQPFDMITMLGFLILLGTVVNNPILIVDKSLHNFRVNRMDALASVNDAVESRLRPIMMTTITTICGLAPLVFIPGAGTELYRGVGAIVLFGLMFSTLVTLTFLPALVTSVLRMLTRKAGS
ncbi:MAG: efflux RND transporter permease subunit [Verrucomicrobiales bacterium]|nr:efflux RND transporter permease subunit [Verrucomicrobiota bacterium JB025]